MLPPPVKKNQCRQILKTDHVIYFALFNCKSKIKQMNKINDYQLKLKQNFTLYFDLIRNMKNIRTNFDYFGKTKFLLVICFLSLAQCEPVPVVMWHGMGDSCCLPFSLGK